MPLFSFDLLDASPSRLCCAEFFWQLSVRLSSGGQVDDFLELIGDAALLFDVLRVEGGAT